MPEVRQDRVKRGQVKHK